MNYTVFFSILILLGFSYLIMGKLAAKSLENQEDYYLSGRSLGFFTLMITLLATQLGGAALLGAAEEAYTHGWAGLLYAGGVSIGFLLLALGIGAKIRMRNVSTLPELFETVFHSPGLRQIAATVSIVSLFLILVGQGVATRKFFGGIGFDSVWLFLGFWLTIILYTVMGGLKAVINTDILQAIFILISFLLVMVFAVLGHPEIIGFISSQELNTVTSSSIPWVGWLIMPMLFMIVGQDMGQRCSAALSPKIVSWATFWAAILYMLFGFIPVFLGLIAKHLGLSPGADQSILMLAVQALTNPTITAIAACGLLMAIISTADSLLCAISSNLAIDFPLIRKLSKGKEISWAKGITLIIGLAAIGLSYLADAVIPLLIAAVEPSIYLLFVPIMLSLIFEHPPKAAAYGAVLMGAGSYLLFTWCIPPVLLPRELLILALSAIGGGTGLLIGRK